MGTQQTVIIWFFFYDDVWIILFFAFFTASIQYVHRSEYQILILIVLLCCVGVILPIHSSVKLIYLVLFVGLLKCKFDLSIQLQKLSQTQKYSY